MPRGQRKNAANSQEYHSEDESTANKKKSKSRSKEVAESSVSKIDAESRSQNEKVERKGFLRESESEMSESSLQE